MTLGFEEADQMMANETTCAGDNNSRVLENHNAFS
jgi:hypothetical protein